MGHIRRIDEQGGWKECCDLKYSGDPERVNGSPRLVENTSSDY